MDLKELQEKLGALYNNNPSGIVFWYDDDASYQEEIDSVVLSADCKLIKLNGNNSFATKLEIERGHSEKKYLVYAPFPRPEDKENPLVDIFYYSQHFYSDHLVQVMGDINMPPECLDTVKTYKKFWSQGNIDKFKELSIPQYTPETVDLGILCVLASVKTYNIEELVRKVVLAGITENAILKKYDNNKITPVFWRVCEITFGYKDINPTIQKFLVTMLVTYMDVQLNGNEPKEWKTFLTKKRNDALIFIKNLMNNTESRDFYDSFTKKAASELNVSKLITQIPLNDVVSCDALEDFDNNIIQWIVAKIEDGMLDERIADMTIPEICSARLRVACHYSDVFREKYEMLSAAHFLLKGVAKPRYQSGVKEAVEDYVGGTYLIDTYYRKFYYHLDRVVLEKNFEKVRDLVENMYTNKYLTDSTFKWNQSLTDEAFQAYPGVSQREFFNRFVHPFMKESGGGRVVVIISDGMRYECAAELLENLELDEKCDAKIFNILSGLPSETTLGMASLLPNKDIIVDEKMNIIVDELHCGNSTSDRQKILQKRVTKSACYDFDTIMHAKQAEVREMFQDKELVYIYQNQIDSRGEGMKTENEVFNACQEAISEIQVLIRRLTGYVSNTRYLITADHGFIYKRDKLPESDKVSVDKYGADTKNKRYLISKNPIAEEGVISRSLTYLSKLNTVHVTTPLGADIIKMAGGGQNYVHGGSSLQEMVVPVIKVNTFKGKQETGLVNVELSTFTRRVTGIEVKLDFMQMEPVTDTVKPRRLQAFFVDADGAKISFPVPITANIKSTDAKDRLIQEKFTLKSGTYNRSQEYFLVIADQDDETVEVHRYKFEIDIADMNF